MNGKPNIVWETLQKVLSAVERSGDGSFTEDMAIEIEQQILRQYGGDRPPTLPKKGRAATINKQRALDEAKKTGRPAEAAARYGISRATLYRLLGKK